MCGFRLGSVKGGDMEAGGVLRVVFILPIVLGSRHRVMGDKAHYEAERRHKSHYRKIQQSSRIVYSCY